MVRIPVAGKVCAYALDPHEVWKGYNTSKKTTQPLLPRLIDKEVIMITSTIITIIGLIGSLITIYREIYPKDKH